MQVWHTKARLQAVPHPLLQACDAREDSRRDVLGWSAHVALRSDRSNSTPLGAINKRGCPKDKHLFCCSRSATTQPLDPKNDAVCRYYVAFMRQIYSRKSLTNSQKSIDQDQFRDQLTF